MPALLTATALRCIRDDRALFSGLDFSASAGELWQVIGANGAGKTTLLRIIAGLYHFYEGKIDWQPGFEPRRHLGFIGHQTGLREELTACENLRWQSGLHGLGTQGIEAGLAALGMAGYEDVPIAQMSAGQKRRVALSRLWSHSARIWILDEPFTAIDRHGVACLEQRLQELANAGALVVYTSHHEVGAGVSRIHLARSGVEVSP